MNSSHTESSLLSVNQILAMLKARWKLIGVVATLVLLVTLVISVLTPKSWTSSSDIYVDYRENDPIGGRNFSAMLDDSYMQTQITMIRSQAVAQRVIERLGLQRSAAFRESAEKIGEARAHELLMESLIRNTEVANQRNSRVLEVAYSAKTPEMARDYAAATVEAFIALSQELAGRAARSRSEQYGAQLEELRKEADAIQENITQYQRETGLLKGTDDNNLEVRQLNLLTVELAQARVRMQEAQARGDANRRLIDSGVRADEIPDLGQFGPIQDVKGKLADVERRIGEESAVLGSNHPTMVGLRAERDGLQAQLRRSADSVVRSQGSDRERLALQQAALERDIVNQRDKVLQQMQARDRLLSYERQLASVQQVYNSALEKYDGLLMASNITLPNLAVLRVAELPSVPSGPKVKRNLVSGLAVGLIAGVFLALLLELINRRVRCREDMERGLGLPLLGHVGRPGGARA